MSRPIIVNPERIALYSRCPKQFSYGYTDIPREPSSAGLNQDNQLIATIIKDVYTHIAKKGSIPQWQLIIRWTERHYREALGLPESKLTTERDYREIKTSLTILHKWYTQIFPQFQEVAYVNFPLVLNLENKITYEDYLDVVTIGKDVCIFGFSESARIGRDLVNNLVFQVQIWGFFRYAERLPDRVICLSINDTNIVPISIYPMSSIVKKTEGFVRQILRGMCDGDFYPSYGAECPHCPYRATCSF